MPDEKARMTYEERQDRERSRGAEVAAANAKKFEEAQKARAAEEAAANPPVDPAAPAPATPTMQTDFEKAASGGVFPHAAEPYQPKAPEPPAVEPAKE